MTIANNNNGTDKGTGKITETIDDKIDDRFRIDEFDEYYKIHGVEYRNGIAVVRLNKILLGDDEKERNQQEWISYSLEAMEKNGCVAGSADLDYAILRAIAKNQNNPRCKTTIMKIVDFLRLDGVYNLITTTQISYMQNRDFTVHDAGMPNTHAIENTTEKKEKKIAGNDEWLIKSEEDESIKKACSAVLGSDDVKEINNTFRWLTGKNSYVKRLDLDERGRKIVVFRLEISNNPRMYLDFRQNPNYRGYAIGVKIEEFTPLSSVSSSKAPC